MLLYENKRNHPFYRGRRTVSLAVLRKGISFTDFKIIKDFYQSSKAVCSSSLQQVGNQWWFKCYRLHLSINNENYVYLRPFNEYVKSISAVQGLLTQPVLSGQRLATKYWSTEANQGEAERRKAS